MIKSIKELVSIFSKPENEGQMKSRVGLFYKNFAAHAGISHIGLGVAAQKNAEYLNARGYDVTVVPAKNNIDVVEAIREHGFTHVVISAPWLSALDVDTMVRHFKDVQFAITSHSNIGFLQADPGALKLLRQYALISKEVDNLKIGGNSVIFADWFSDIYDVEKLLLPNLYEVYKLEEPRCGCSKVLRVGTFGAIRPQKNVVTAAAAAMLLGRMTGRQVEFNVSTGREDGGGNVILNAIRQMMIQVPNVELVERHWSNWHEFKRVVRDMDILFQMSYTESFNMVTADGISEGVPSVTSDAIVWVPDEWKAQGDNVFSVAETAHRILKHRDGEVERGMKALKEHNERGLKYWEEFLK
jgi:glycosyltransferase involved in cell wall biosynthesis